MRMVSPDVGVPEIAIAQNQLDYQELTAGVLYFSDGSQGLLTRWRLTDEEKEAIAQGEDLYVTILTFGQPMQPIMLHVSKPDYLP